MDSPVLYMLAAPIGNLGDISLRALQLLRETPLIAAEDTRVARRLLTALDIPAPRLLSLRARNEMRAAEKVADSLRAGGSVIYLADAGTPAVSDPGARLARVTRAAGYAVVPVPGASALTAFIAAAGLPDGALHFYGFPPAAAAARRRLFNGLRALGGASVFYEAPHRIAAALRDLADALGGGQRAVLGRELTKHHEQIADDTLDGLSAAIAAGDIPARGEFVLAVENPAHSPAEADGWRVFQLLTPLLPPRQAAAAAAKIAGVKAAALYDRHLSSGG